MKAKFYFSKYSYDTKLLQTILTVKYYLWPFNNSVILEHVTHCFMYIYI